MAMVALHSSVWAAKLQTNTAKKIKQQKQNSNNNYNIKPHCQKIGCSFLFLKPTIVLTVVIQAVV